MPLVDINMRTLGDLVVREFSPADGYCREEVTVPAGTYPIGTVVFGTDLAATFAKYTTASVITDNMLAIVFGDHFDVRETFTSTAAAPALVLHRGPLQVSDFLLKEANGLSDAELAPVIAALAAQGVDVLKSV